MAQRDVKIQRSFPEGFGQRPVVRVVQMVVEFETDPEHGVGHIVFALPHLEERLAKVPAQVERRPDLGGKVLVSRFVQLSAQFPT